MRRRVNGVDGLGGTDEPGLSMCLLLLQPAGVISIAASGPSVSSAAVTADGGVYTWGCGRDGRLGLSAGGTLHELDQSRPALVESLLESLAGSPNASTASNHAHLSVDPDAQRPPDPVIQASMGEYCGAAVTASGRVFTWGKVALGRAPQRGPPDTTGRYHDRQLKWLGPGQVTNWSSGARDRGYISDSSSTAGIPVITSVSCGREHMLAIDADGNCYGWGVNSSYATGHGDVDSSSSSGSHGRSSMFNGGGSWTSSSGTRRGWSASLDKQKEIMHLQRITSLADAGVRITAVSAGREHSLLLDDQGRVWTCGGNDYGQCGTHFSSRYCKVPTLVKGFPSKIAMIAAGEYHSVAVDVDGNMYTWGSGSNGQLGHGDWSDVGSPRQVRPQSPSSAQDHFQLQHTQQPPATATQQLLQQQQTRNAPFQGRVRLIAAGGAHTLACTDTDACFSFGRGRSGQLGRGDVIESIAAYRTEPVLIPRLSHLHPAATVLQLAAGRDHSLALVQRHSGHGGGSG